MKWHLRLAGAAVLVGAVSVTGASPSVAPARDDDRAAPVVSAQVPEDGQVTSGAALTVTEGRSALSERLAAARIWTRRFDWADDLLRFGLPGSDPALGRLAAGLRAATDGSR